MQRDGNVLQRKQRWCRDAPPLGRRSLRLRLVFGGSRNSNHVYSDVVYIFDNSNGGRSVYFDGDLDADINFDSCVGRDLQHRYVGYRDIDLYADNTDAELVVNSIVINGNQHNIDNDGNQQDIDNDDGEIHGSRIANDHEDNDYASSLHVGPICPIV